MKPYNKLISILLLAMSWQIQAADRALIVGITEYKNIKNLKGIGYDVGMAGKIAEMLAFDPSQIKVLTGKQATKSNIKNAFATWLKEGVSRNDRIFFYFSGHGGRVADKNGDESDGQDEFITTYDITGSVKDGGYIIDDDLSLWLSNIESQHKIVMLDSCNSGTATKSLAIAKMGNLKLYSKLLNLTDNPHSFSSSKNLSDEKGNFIEGAQHQITLSAARDFEEAQATDAGSLFTLG
ncbi:MAG: caspase family protein, partial [Alcanivoracaceae bacterium]|nr:caspase family protein [Alcanivoracaceae bacterium]